MPGSTHLAFYLLLVIAGLVIVVWFARYVFSVVKGNYEREGGSLWFIPGSGTHGAPGGQGPPIVPDNPDWDSDRRIK